MKKIFNILISSNLLLFSNIALSSQPISGTSILEIGTYSENRIFVTTGTKINPASCAATTLAIDKDDENFEAMYTALLVSMTNSGKANLRVSSTECVNNVNGPNGTPTYPKIVYVGIIP